MKKNSIMQPLLFILTLAADRTMHYSYLQAEKHVIHYLKDKKMKLSDQEKNKIELEEHYRNEVLQKFRSKSKLDLLETIIKILQGVAIVVGVWATYIAYKKQIEDRAIQEKVSNEQTAKEYRKGFYDKQFQFYSEACDATSILATEKIGTVDYIQARKSFYRLFWGKLSLVEDKSVEAKMVEFERLLSHYENENMEVTQSELQQASLKLAHAASKYTINVWLDSTERNNYNR